MKKLLLILMLLPISIYMIGQDIIDREDNSADNYDKNEIRLNVATAIAGLPEINYERFVTDNMGVGLAVAFSLENAKTMHLRSLLLPYYRVYFGERAANGFFIEGNMAVAGEKEEIYDNYDSNITSYESTTSFGCGASIGYKFLNRNGVIGELCLGVGRLFGNTFVDAYPRVGVCIGKRF